MNLSNLSGQKMSSSQIKHILLVEESPSLQNLMIEALGKTSNQHKVHRVKNSQEALNFLYQRGEYARSPRPQLILIDVNRPEMDEQYFLQTIKSDSSLKIIPVVVFTNSDNQDEILTGYQLSANCYIHKPLELDDLFKVVDKLAKFWLKFVQLP